MKIRKGWVSNSSSSSFIVKYDKDVIYPKINLDINIDDVSDEIKIVKNLEDLHDLLIAKYYNLHDDLKSYDVFKSVIESYYKNEIDPRLTENTYTFDVIVKVLNALKEDKKVLFARMSTDECGLEGRIAHIVRCYDSVIKFVDCELLFMERE